MTSVIFIVTAAFRCCNNVFLWCSFIGCLADLCGISYGMWCHGSRRSCCRILLSLAKAQVHRLEGSYLLGTILQTLTALWLRNLPVSPLWVIFLIKTQSASSDCHRAPDFVVLISFASVCKYPCIADGLGFPFLVQVRITDLTGGTLKTLWLLILYT